MTRGESAEDDLGSCLDDLAFRLQALQERVRGSEGAQVAGSAHMRSVQAAVLDTISAEMLRRAEAHGAGDNRLAERYVRLAERAMDRSLCLRAREP